MLCEFFCFEAHDLKKFVRLMSFQSLEILKDESFKV
jgi:hypothetical protein